MNSERELFEDEFSQEYDMTKNDIGLYLNQNTYNAFVVWVRSAKRQGYKLVPLEMSWQKADELASKEWDKNKTMFCNENRDITALQVEEFRLRWCRNKAHQIMIDYKAMIGATN